MGDCSLELPPFVALKAFRKLTWSDQRCSFHEEKREPFREVFTSIGNGRYRLVVEGPEGEARVVSVARIPRETPGEVKP